MIVKRFLYAPNIHQGGGRILLLSLLEVLKDEVDISFVLDARMPLPPGVQLAGRVCRVKGTLFSRLFFEWRLCSLLKPDTLLLGMGNLPPLFAHQGIQKVFVQNRYLIDDVPSQAFPILVRLRLMIERWWLRTRAVHVNHFIVQTSTMQRLIKDRLGKDAEILPFVATEDDLSPEDNFKPSIRYDFIYVASGEPHKNHKTLVEAWVKLAEKGYYPSLCLTLNAKRFPKLCAWVSTEIKRHGLNISMIGERSHAEVQQLYHQSAAMIYPSLFESFGLPMIEAVMAGLPVLASNSSYVTDVIKPSAVFDPSSSQSIADAVELFPSKPSLLNIHLLDANGFLMRTFSRGVGD